MAASPVCASFSQAITPPCRIKAHPSGVPWCSELQKAKNEAGNEQLRFVLSLVRCVWLNELCFGLRTLMGLGFGGNKRPG